MEEKIILQDFTVLLVCTSNKWSTIERRVIFDSSFLRNMGCNPIILCRKDSQIDIAAQVEDIPIAYVKGKNFNFLFGGQYYLELRDLIKEKRFDLVHCYSLSATWMASLLLKSNPKIPLLFTLNQNVRTVYQNYFSKWLLGRVDAILSLSEEVKEFAEETFPIPTSKIINLGSGIEVTPKKKQLHDAKVIGCIINDINELKRLRFLLKIFKMVKSFTFETKKELSFYVFLGPRIYKKDKGKAILSEFEYEFYEGDILLYSLENKGEMLKEIDILIGLAFEEPLNDFEVSSIMNCVPVLFPRTAMRQNLLFRYNTIGESYRSDDAREAKDKLIKIITNYQQYTEALDVFHGEINEAHGLDNYALNLQEIYARTFKLRRQES